MFYHPKRTLCRESVVSTLFTLIYVLDIKTSDVLGQPTAILHVVSPSYLGETFVNVIRYCLNKAVVCKEILIK